MAVDLDLIEQGIKPLPATPAELAAMAELGPADYEIYSEMLSIICQEGKNIMTKMGISAMLHSGDSVAAIYTPQGDLVTAILGTYLHCVTGQIPIKFILKYWKDNPTVGIRAGRRLLLQRGHLRRHPQPGPVRRGPRLPRRRADRLDGGRRASGRDRRQRARRRDHHRRSRHDEGMKLTPIKIGERYQLRDDLLKMMENFISRAPRMQVTDVRARVSGADRVRLRLEQLAAKRGATVPVRPVPEDDHRDRRRGQVPDPGLERRDVPAYRVPGHDRCRGRADPGAPGPGQGGRPPHHRPVGHLTRARGQLPGAGRVHPGALRGEPLLVPLPRLPGLGRDAGARRLRHPARDDP